MILKMPKMNGFELYQEIEKIDNRELFPTLKVVDCFTKKPITNEDLVERIITELATPS